MRVRYGPPWWHPEVSPLRDLREAMREAEEEYHQAGGRVLLGTVRVIHMSSDSRPGLVHELRLRADGTWCCDCESYIYGGSGQCKHTRKAAKGER